MFRGNKGLLKKSSIKKGVSIFTLGAMLIGSTSIKVLADGRNGIKEVSKLTSQKEYSLGELSMLSYDELINYIKEMNPSEVKKFFHFNKEAKEFFEDKERVNYIINSLENSARNYTSEDSMGIENLIGVLSGGYYLGYYNNELSYLSKNEFKNKCLPAMRLIERNKNFSLGTTEQNKVVKALGILIGNTSIDNEIINNSSKILKEITANPKAYGEDGIRATYELAKGINDRTIYILNVESREEKSKTPFYRNIDTYLEALENSCLIGEEIGIENNWFVNNMIYFTGMMCKFRGDSRYSQKALTEALTVYPYGSYTYLEAAENLNMAFRGYDFNGNYIDLVKLKEDAKEKYLPKTYTFDNGKFIVRAGDKVSVEKIKKLYWASKEVKAQFIRIIQNDESLDKNHADDILTVVIYNSPKEYKINKKLYGYNTNNGGIYVEQKGTFFTYERSNKESVYTLEELFRHEFTHYLQGRYLVHGMWGDGEFYKNNLLTWFDEGTSEFFAGSTREDGIKPRKAIVKSLGSSKGMSLDKLLHAKYGSWDFYNYSFSFLNYMYKEDINTLRNICNYVRNNDVNSFKDYIASISNDSKLNNAYENNIEELKGDIGEIGTPLVSDEYLEFHPYKESSEIYEEIEKVSKLKNISSEEEKSQFFYTFDLSGVYTGGPSKGEAEDWKDMNSKLDGILKELSKKEWNGYKTLTAYFVNHRVNSKGEYEYDITFHGILNKDKNIKFND